MQVCSRLSLSFSVQRCVWQASQCASGSSLSPVPSDERIVNWFKMKQRDFVPAAKSKVEVLCEQLYNTYCSNKHTHSDEALISLRSRSVRVACRKTLGLVSTCDCDSARSHNLAESRTRSVRDSARNVFLLKVHICCFHSIATSVRSYIYIYEMRSCIIPSSPMTFV